MNPVRNTKLKIIGAVALSSTVLVGTGAAALSLKGRLLVRWADVVSVLTLATVSTSSTKLKFNNGTKTTISTPETATPVSSGSTVSGVPATKLGINLTGPAYFIGNRAFLNLLQGDGYRLVNPQGGWSEMPADRLDSYKRVVDLRAGEQYVRILSIPTRARRGESVDIICRWQGSGTVELHGPLAKNTRKVGQTISFTYVPTSEASLRLQISNINPSDPIRNADCREADADPNAIFEPTYLAEVGRYSVLRFMKWSYGGVEGNKPVSWSTRTKAGDELINGPDGIAIEYMIQMANELGADPWFCIPYNADADYVRKFAELVRTKLNPDRKAG